MNETALQQNWNEWMSKYSTPNAREYALHSATPPYRSHLLYPSLLYFSLVVLTLPRHPLASFDRFEEHSVSRRMIRLVCRSFEWKDNYLPAENRAWQVKDLPLPFFLFFTTRSRITSLYFYSYNSLVPPDRINHSVSWNLKANRSRLNLTVTNKYLQCSCATTIVRYTRAT